MAVDKEALICLSRVYSYYFKCNFPLFYVYPALTRYLSILFLNILTLLACTHSSDNLFHTLMVLCENENFGNDDFGVEAFWIGDAARVGYFVPLNGPLNGHPPSITYGITKCILEIY